MKNGFTLIELLTVIIILGLIATISVPVVQKEIKKSQKNAFIVGVGSVIDSYEQTKISNYLSGEPFRISFNGTDLSSNVSYNRLKLNQDVTGWRGVMEEVDETGSSITTSKLIYALYKDGVCVYRNKNSLSQVVTETNSVADCLTVSGTGLTE